MRYILTQLYIFCATLTRGSNGQIKTKFSIQINKSFNKVPKSVWKGFKAGLPAETLLKNSSKFKYYNSKYYSFANFWFFFDTCNSFIYSTFYKDSNFKTIQFYPLLR